MNRDALLLYLQNVRDLEVAKIQLQKLQKQETQQTNQYLLQHPVKPVYMAEPKRQSENGGCIETFAWVMLVLSGMGLIAGVGAAFEGDLELGFLTAIMVILTVVFIPSLFFAAILPAKQRKKDEAAYQNALEKQIAYNERQDAVAEENKRLVQLMKTQYKKRMDDYRYEGQKVEALLASFYGMNLLASPYRNLASVCYIYDYMATSQATLEETLIHERMENGIQRLESKLDEIVDRIDDVIYETRCARMENKTAIDRMITQNNQMLSQLQSIEGNTADAAVYAQLSANYSKANAYFSLANYLKR